MKMFKFIRWALRGLFPMSPEKFETWLRAGPFPVAGSTPVRAADCDEWKSAKLAGERDEARAQLAELQTLLDTPEVEDFDKAVPLEAAHQVKRWGSDHDAGKEPQDWFWLLGYLAGKALASASRGDTEKARHHCISSAAALRNWHAHLRSGESVMRPGISEEKSAALSGERQPPRTLEATWDLVIEDIRGRDRTGEKEYGTRLHAHNGRNPLQDAYEEALDLSVYLKQTLIEREPIPPAESVPESNTKDVSAEAERAHEICWICKKEKGQPPERCPGQTMRTPKEIYQRRKKERFKKKTRENRQRQKERRAGYLTDPGKFDQLEAEGLPRLYEMAKPVL